MSLLKRIIDAFRPEDEVPEFPAFGVSPAAQTRLHALPEGTGVVIGSEGTSGDVLRLNVAERATLDAVTVDGFDPERLKGLILDWDEENNQWRFGLEHRLHASATPNPNGRLYKTNRRLASGAPAFFTRGTVNPWIVDRLFECEDVATVLLRDHTVTLERTGDAVDWGRLDQHLDRVLQEYGLAAGAVIENRGSPEYTDPFEADVARVLEAQILPTVHRDGGDLRLLEVKDGIVRLNLAGACHSCPSSTQTLHRGVEQVLRRAFPGRIQGVERV